MLVSGSRDGRVKLWDVGEGRSACTSTWRLPGPCLSLVDGLGQPGCMVVQQPNALQVRRAVGTVTAACVTVHARWRQDVDQPQSAWHVTVCVCVQRRCST
jgi:hypothetical protein